MSTIKLRWIYPNLAILGVNSNILWKYREKLENTCSNQFFLNHVYNILRIGTCT